MDNLCKTHQLPITLVVLPNFYKLNCVMFFFRLSVSITWQFYYCVFTFVSCVHLYDFAIHKNTS